MTTNSNSNNDPSSAQTSEHASGSTTGSKTGKAERPSSIGDALRILDEALAGQASNLKELVNNDYQNIRTAMSGFAAAETFRNVTETVRNFGTQTYGRVSEAAKPRFERTREATTQAYTDFDSHVRTNPWPVLGGLAVGAFALGFLLGRNRGGDTPTVATTPTSTQIR